jgi:hypothetical protein
MASEVICAYDWGKCRRSSGTFRCNLTEKEHRRMPSAYLEALGEHEYDGRCRMQLRDGVCPYGH